MQKARLLLSITLLACSLSFVTIGVSAKITLTWYEQGEVVDQGQYRTTDLTVHATLGIDNAEDAWLRKNAGNNFCYTASPPVSGTDQSYWFRSCEMALFEYTNQELFMQSLSAYTIQTLISGQAAKQPLNSVYIYDYYTDEWPNGGELADAAIPLELQCTARSDMIYVLMIWTGVHEYVATSQVHCPEQMMDMWDYGPYHTMSRSEMWSTDDGTWDVNLFGINDFQQLIEYEFIVDNSTTPIAEAESLIDKVGAVVANALESAGPYIAPILGALAGVATYVSKRNDTNAPK